MAVICRYTQTHQHPWSLCAVLHSFAITRLCNPARYPPVYLFGLFVPKLTKHLVEIRRKKRKGKSSEEAEKPRDPKKPQPAVGNLMFDNLSEQVSCRTHFRLYWSYWKVIVYHGNWNTWFAGCSLSQSTSQAQLVVVKTFIDHQTSAHSCRSNMFH